MRRAERMVLFTSYYFPPMGMGGVQRAVKFVKYLPDFGWLPLVLTVKEVEYFVSDESLLSELRQHRLHRTGSLDPQRLLHLLKKFCGFSRQPRPEPFEKNSVAVRILDGLIRWLLLPDGKVLWVPFALLRALNVLRRCDCRVVFTTAPPFSAHLIGLFAKMMRKSKWVADFRDQWTGGHLDNAPTALHRFYCRLLEKIVLKTADAVICATPHLTESLAAKSARAHADGVFYTITNGYDEEDIASRTETQGQDDSYTIVYCGCISHLADPDRFLLALRKFLDDAPEVPSIRFDIIGKIVGIDLAKLITTHNLEGIVRLQGYLPHKEAIARLQRADVLLLLLTGTTSADVIPGKTFEYLGVGRPVLTLGPEGDMAELMRSAGLGVVVTKDEVENIVAGIKKLYDSRNSGAVVSRAQKNFLDRYRRRELTGRLAGVLDEMTKEERV